MRQVWIPRFGGVEVLKVKEAVDPQPSSGEVRIRVTAAGVNFADVSARAGLYPDAPKPPMVVGYEVSGTIDAVGAGVDSFQPGDLVMAMTRFGGYSDVVVVPAIQATHLHQGADPVAAAGIPVNFLTAYVMLNHLGSVRPGNTVLIHSAAGGVGLAALQLARNLGAVTIGTASAGKHARLKEFGLDHAIDYRTQDFEKEVKRITRGRGVDVALDAHGGGSLRKSYKCLAPMGRLFFFGVSSAHAQSRGKAWRTFPKMLITTPILHPLQLINANKGVFGINVGHLWGEAQLLGEVMGVLAGMWERGEINPVIDSTYPFEQAGKAHEQLEQARNFGKVVLKA
jgi:NADPH:quinone reductase-like Zn-dependent oxidoreductase